MFGEQPTVGWGSHSKEGWSERVLVGQRFENNAWAQLGLLCGNIFYLSSAPESVARCLNHSVPASEDTTKQGTDRSIHIWSSGLTLQLYIHPYTHVDTLRHIIFCLKPWCLKDVSRKVMKQETHWRVHSLSGLRGETPWSHTPREGRHGIRRDSTLGLSFRVRERNYTPQVGMSGETWMEDKGVWELNVCLSF